MLTASPRSCGAARRGIDGVSGSAAVLFAAILLTIPGGFVGTQVLAQPPADAAESSDEGADEPDATSSEEEAQAEDAPRREELPASLKELRPLYFLQDHASGLVPESFRPVTMAQLDERLSRWPGRPQPPAEKPQLVRAVYVARLNEASLSSTRSTWEIAHDSPSTARLPLGKLGFALESLAATRVRSEQDDAEGESAEESGEPDSSSGAAVPVFTDAGGESSIPVTGSTKFTFGWSASGRETDREVLYDIAVPKAAGSRWLIEVPKGFRVEALDGVGQTLPSPPPEAPSRELGRDATWYAIEAGGLSRLRLRVVKLLPGPGQGRIAVRQASAQYELVPSAVRFTVRLVIDPPRDGVLPTLEVSNGRVSSISVDGMAATWTESGSAAARLLKIDPGRLDLASTTGINITVDGETAWETGRSGQKLPWLRLRDADPILLGNEKQMKLLVDSRLSLLMLDLPDRWRHSSAPETDERRTTYRLVGPWGEDAPQVRVGEREEQFAAESVLRLSAGDGALRAAYDISVNMSAVGPRPVRLRVEPRWTVDSVVLTQSGRAVDLPHDDSARRSITIWPTADELKDGKLLVRVLGTQPLSIDGDLARYPATSFLSILNSRNRCLSVVTPPSGFRWTADVSLRTNRIGWEDVPAEAREIIGDLPSGALLLDITHARPAALVSRLPAAAFSAAALTRLTATNNRLVENLVVRCDIGSSDLNRIRIEFAPGKRPDIEWSVQEESGGGRLIRARRLAPAEARSPDASLTAADEANEAVAAGDAAALPEVWELELERAGNEVIVVSGRREYPLPGESRGAAKTSSAVKIDLPTVVGGGTRLAQVWVDPALEVRRGSPGVLRVPRPVGESGSVAGAWSKLLGDVPLGGTALRYDGGAMEWVEVAAVDSSTGVPILWQETVSIVASGRGGDAISATYTTDAGTVLAIDHDSDLRLIGITDAQGNVPPHTAGRSRLTIQAPEASSQITVHWTRPGTSGGIISRRRPPRIEAAGVVLRRDWQISAGPDTVIPAAVAASFLQPPERGRFDLRRSMGFGIGGESNADPTPTLRFDPESAGTFYLVDRAPALSGVGMIGCLLFAISWWIALRRPAAAAVLFLIAVAAPAVLPGGWFYWLAAVCVPVAAGGLVGTTLRLQPDGSDTTAAARDRRSGADGSDASGDGGSRSPSSGDLTQTFERRDPPSSRSLLGKFGLTLLLAIPSLMIAGSGEAQQRNEAESRSGRGAGDGNDANAHSAEPGVLIPTHEDGSVAGDKVYISRRYYEALFRDPAALTAATPEIVAAAYRLRLEGMTEAGMPAADWEIRYTLARLNERGELTLPFRSTNVRSVQWLTDDEPKPLRWVADGESAIRITVPPAAAATLVLRLLGDVESPERTLRQVQLKVPPAASASLVVDSTSAVQQFTIDSARGEIASQPEAGRLTASLGSTDTIDLTATLRQGSRSIPGLAARRYWVHASPDRCEVECEIEPSDVGLRRGADVPLVILSDSLPMLTTDDWLIHSSESLSPRRHLLTLRARQDSPEPIRLLWQFKSRTAEDSDDDSATLTVPDVIAAGSAPTPEATVALSPGEGLQIVSRGGAAETGELAGETVDAVDAFVASWKGYRGTARRVIRTGGGPLRLLVVRQPGRAWKSEESHHLHVRQGEMKLTFDAVVTRGEPSLGPMRLTLPRQCELRELRVNDVPVMTAPYRSGDRLEVTFAEPRDADKFRVRAVVHERVSATAPFQPPRVRIEPIRNVEAVYSLTRVQAMRVEEVNSGGLPELPDASLDIGEQLLNGWIPCWTWQIEESAATTVPQTGPPVRLPGTYRIETQAINLDVIQQTTIRWRQSRWMLDAVIQVRAGAGEDGEPPMLDDLNVELPTAWSAQLTVEPSQAWASRPAIDPATKLLRIRPDAEARRAGAATIRIRATRLGDSDTFLEVPRVQVPVVSAATRRAYIAVPQSVAGRPLMWRADSAVPDRLPDALFMDTDLAEDLADHLVFRTLNNAATVRLEPSRSETPEAKATAADIQLFVQSADRRLAVIRWDLEPGVRDRVAVDIPRGVETIAAWTAGRPATVRPVETSPQESAGGSGESRIEVTTALSRLAQPLVLLCRLHTEVGESAALPQLVDTEVEQTWLTVYQMNRGLPLHGVPQVLSDDASSWQPAPLDQRLLYLARSVLQSTELSISGATDRPQEEVAAWLRSWDERLSKLQSEATRPEPVDGEPSESVPAEEDDSEDEAAEAVDEEAAMPAEPPAPSEAWDSLMRQWRRYVRRVTGGEGTAGHRPTPAVIPATHWQPVWVGRHPQSATHLPPMRVQSGAAGITLGIRIAIAAFVLLGCVWLVHRFRDTMAPVINHPAAWLFAVGFVSLAVAPPPVAIAVCLVALAGPWLVKPTPNPRSTARTTSVRSSR